jgi:uncharacterized protein (TIGR00106 family)
MVADCELLTSCFLHFYSAVIKYLVLNWWRKENLPGGKMALMFLTIIPLGTKSPSVGEYVADIQKVLEKTDFQYELTDMGTVIEGNTEDLLGLAGQLAEMPFSKGVNRVVTQISLDDRRDKKVSIGAKKASVADRLAMMQE